MQEAGKILRQTLLTRMLKLLFMLHCPLPLLVPSREIGVDVFLACYVCSMSLTA